MLILRHAQSEWNLHFSRTRVDPGIPDPALTEDGVRQAEAAVDAVRAHAPRRIVSSPYRRTLQTAAILAEGLGLPVTIEPMVRERNAFSCDQGSHPEHLAAEWPQIDFGGLDRHWWGTRIESERSLATRIASFRAAAAAMNDGDDVVVVSHWGFIRGLTGLEVDNATILRYHRATGTATPA